MEERKYKSHFYYFMLLLSPLILVEILLFFIYPISSLVRIITFPLTILINGIIILYSSSVAYYLIKHTRFRVMGRVIIVITICMPLIFRLWIHQYIYYKL